MALGFAAPTPVQAVTFADGSTHFAEVPRLVNVATNKRAAGSLGPTYTFTLRVPVGATENLGRVVIQQIQGGDQVWYQNIHELRIFEGTIRNQGRNFAIAAIDLNPINNTIVVDFDQTVPPGTTVTIALRPQRNPRSIGTYLFNIRAFPSGPKPAGQFVGTSRIEISERGRDR
ncbi:MAG: DUF2808 domain-containing protein [Cyanobacteria bacterium P01_H01_bin.121]